MNHQLRGCTAEGLLRAEGGAGGGAGSFYLQVRAPPTQQNHEYLGNRELCHLQAEPDRAHAADGEISQKALKRYQPGGDATQVGALR